jgi:nitroreductase
LGVNTCWVCNFDVQACKDLLKLPENEEPIVLIPMGYAPKESVAPDKKRKEMQQLVTYLS